MDLKANNSHIGERVQFEILRKFSGEKRVILGAQLYEMVRQLIEDGIRNRYPDLEEREINRRIMEIIAPWFKKKH